MYMSKKIIGLITGLAALAVLIILGLKFLLKPPAAVPPTSEVIPVSGTPGINVWTGTLSLSTQEAKLAVGGETFVLKIPGKEAVSFLKEKFFQDGDTVNVMGKLAEEGKTITVSGINKFKK